MKYLSLFSGIGGFEKGIQQAYELSKVGVESKDSTNIESRTSQHAKCPLCIAYSDETIRNTDVQEKRGGEEAQKGVDEEGQGLHPISGKTTISSDNRNNEHVDGSVDERQPTCIGYSEIDKYAVQIYEKHFNHKNYGDITKINEKELPDFDLVVGGFPCPSFSIAGKRKGLQDPRGELIFDIIRIIKEKQPKMFLLENVKGIISHDKGKTMEIICEALCECGYAIDFEILNSKNFGVAQSRERCFFVGLRLDTVPKDMII